MTAKWLNKYKIHELKGERNMLFYFTGTGNSLYVARQIEEKPISIPQILHQENLKF